MKKFFKEFGDFIKRGNVLDMAVGIIIGSAFTAIVTALTGGILQPIINWVILKVFGASDATQIYTYLHKVMVMDEELGYEVIDVAKSIYIDWGAFIMAIINFILVAFVVFCIVKAVNRAKDEANINQKMKEKCEAKMVAGQELTDTEKKWVARMEKKHPDMVPHKPEPAPAPAPAEPTATEKLLAEILAELKKD